MLVFRFLTNLALCNLILGMKLPLFFLVTLGYGNAWIFRDPTACLVAGIADSLAFRLVVASKLLDKLLILSITNYCSKMLILYDKVKMFSNEFLMI